MNLYRRVRDELRAYWALFKREIRIPRWAGHGAWGTSRDRTRSFTPEEIAELEKICEELDHITNKIGHK